MSKADKEFLQWIHDRMHLVHGENESYDYMHKLRSIIASIDSNITQAAANKAAEEDGMPALPEPVTRGFESFTEKAGYFEHFDTEQMQDYARAAIAADRASRQVANKADVDLDAARYQFLRHADLDEMKRIYWPEGEVPSGAEFDAAIDHALGGVATPPATTGGASATPTGAMPKDLAIQCLNALDVDSEAHAALSKFIIEGGATGASTVRDKAFEEAASICEKKYEVRAASGHAREASAYRNCAVQIRALKGSVGASTALTDERIDAAMLKYSTFVTPGAYSLTSFECVEDMRSFARDVAAQAGQVAVPGWINVDDRLPEFQHECTSSGCEVSDSLMVYGQNEFGTTGCGFGHARDDGTWSTYETEYDQLTVVKVTHWMPLPAAPSPAKESK